MDAHVSKTNPPLAKEEAEIIETIPQELNHGSSQRNFPPVTKPSIDPVVVSVSISSPSSSPTVSQNQEISPSSRSAQNPNASTQETKEVTPEKSNHHGGNLSNIDDTTKRRRQTKPRRRRRHGARNQHRHKLLVRWLAHTFPDAMRLAKSQADADDVRDQTPRRRHVLDVAGGKGELSARLTLCHTTNVTMIDPRQADVMDCFQKVVYKTLPKKWQEKISGGDQDGGAKRLESILEKRFRQLVVCFPCDGSVGYQDNDSGTFGVAGDNDEIIEAIKQATLLIGMHADGATEAIVDLALHYKKPFVVVPCCVFPNFFRHRFVPPALVDDSTGDEYDVDVNVNVDDLKEQISNDDDNDKTKPELVPVRTHQDFCRYLALKDSHFVVETLPFEGRNIAIWWDGVNRDVH